MAITLPLAPFAGNSRRSRASLLRELSVATRDTDLLDRLEVPDELRPSLPMRTATQDLDVGLSGWQRGLGVAIALAVVVLMIIATRQLLELLLWVSAAAAVVMATCMAAYAVLTRGGRERTDRR